jgi:protein translocase, SecG subunit
MALVFATLIIITCVLLVLIVLVQNPKGGGLSSSFGGSGTQLFGGVKKTTDFLDRGTWGLAILLVVLVLAANVTLTPEAAENGVENSRILDTDVSEPIAPQQPQNIPSFEEQLPGAGGEDFPEPVEEE